MKIEINESTTVFKPFELKILFESAEEAEAMYSLCHYARPNEVKQEIEQSPHSSAAKKNRLTKATHSTLPYVLSTISTALEQKITIQE